MKFDNKGFSLLEVMIAGGLIVGLGYSMMSVMKIINSGQMRIDQTTETANLSQDINMILSNPNFCKASLGGMPFKKSDISASGLSAELWLSDQTGNRTIKKLNGKDNVLGLDMSKYGKLNILSIKLFLDNPANGPGGNYNEASSHSDLGRLKISVDLSSSNSMTKNIEVPITLALTTNASNVTSILSCSRSVSGSSSSLTPQTLTCVSNCVSTGWSWGRDSRGERVRIPNPCVMTAPTVTPACSSANANELGLYKKRLYACDGVSTWYGVASMNKCVTFSEAPIRKGRKVLGGHTIPDEAAYILQGQKNVEQICKEDMLTKYGADFIKLTDSNIIQEEPQNSGGSTSWWKSKNQYARLPYSWDDSHGFTGRGPGEDTYIAAYECCADIYHAIECL